MCHITLFMTIMTVNHDISNDSLIAARYELSWTCHFNCKFKFSFVFLSICQLGCSSCSDGGKRFLWVSHHRWPDHVIHWSRFLSDMTFSHHQSVFDIPWRPPLAPWLRVVRPWKDFFNVWGDRVMEKSIAFWWVTCLHHWHSLSQPDPLADPWPVTSLTLPNRHDTWPNDITASQDERYFVTLLHHQWYVLYIACNGITLLCYRLSVPPVRHLHHWFYIIHKVRDTNDCIPERYPVPVTPLHHGWLVKPWHDLVTKRSPMPVTLLHHWFYIVDNTWRHCPSSPDSVTRLHHPLTIGRTLTSFPWCRVTRWRHWSHFSAVWLLTSPQKSENCPGWTRTGWIKMREVSIEISIYSSYNGKFDISDA